MVKFGRRDPFFVLILVLVWRILLLAFTAQPIPASDAFGYDGAVINYLHGGGYCNPSMAMIFPISGTQVYSMYPPLYQVVLLAWMEMFGTSAVSAMAMHLALFAISAFLTVAILRRFFPAATGYALAALLLFGFTFGDRPESLAYVLGLGALWLVARQITGAGSKAGIGGALTAILLLGLYTSAIVGAYFFGVGFLACMVAWIGRQRQQNEVREKLFWFGPFIAVAVLFVVITATIAREEPLWWAGFMEAAHQQTVMSLGAHLPSAGDLLKLVRTVPVFVLALVFLPPVFARWREVAAEPAPWIALTAGIFLMGWAMLLAAVTLLSGNYVNYTAFSQIILAAGLLALTEKFFPGRQRLLRGALVACVLLVSVRAIGMSTWGAACAWKNSYVNSQAVVRSELRPFVATNRPVLISSAFLYCAADLRVRNPVHCDWYFDHTKWGSQLDALIRCRPPKLVLTQFDYYRTFKPLLNQLSQKPELVEVQVHDFALVRPPDAIPSIQRVLQHISWAPVIVDLDWKPGADQEIP